MENSYVDCDERTWSRITYFEWWNCRISLYINLKAKGYGEI